MKTKSDQKGVTLIELLIALVISGIIVAAIYRMFVAQTRAYTVQDQVTEVQQNVRNAMERIVKDLRMAGFDDDKLNALGVNLTFASAVTNPTANGITVNYEHHDMLGAPEIRRVTYSVNGSNQLLRDQNPADPGAEAGGDPILDNVTQFALTYGVDVDPISGIWLNDRRLHSWVAAGATAGVNIVAVRVQLSAAPASNNPDVNTQISPRSLDTVVTLRNQLSNKKFAY